MNSKKIPAFDTDEALEAFRDQDIGDYVTPETFRPARFRILPEERAIEMAPFTVGLEQEEDGRWIAEIPQLPGVLTYGATPEQARNAAHALALRVLADRREHGEP